jgi:thiamine-phosphate pyrophosphorylase
VDILQLRAKEFSAEIVRELARMLLHITRPANIPLIINDHAHIAGAVAADGVHLGQEDLSVAEGRRLACAETPSGAPPIIGKSTHSLAQAVAAEKEGADYIGFGPLFATATKPGRPAIGLAAIRALHETVRIPIFCIGGIRRENLEAVLDAGALRVVIVSAILQARDIANYCRDVRARVAENAGCAPERANR